MGIHTPPKDPSRRNRYRVIGTAGAMAVGLVALAMNPPEHEEAEAQGWSTEVTTTSQAASWDTVLPVYTAPVQTADALVDNGTWRVGLDIIPGVYRVTPDNLAEPGYWMRCEDLDCVYPVASGMAERPFWLDIRPEDAAVRLVGVTLTPR